MEDVAEDLASDLQTNGRQIYIETSSQPIYQPTQAFYTRAGYVLEATLKDFYAPGDDKLVFVKRLAA